MPQRVAVIDMNKGEINAIASKCFLGYISRSERGMQNWLRDNFSINENKVLNMINYWKKYFLVEEEKIKGHYNFPINQRVYVSK